MKDRLLVDLNNLGWRCYHANADLATIPRPGKPSQGTGVIYGSIKSLLGYARTYKPSQIICFADVGKSWRADILESYKGNRAPKNDEERERRAEFNRQFVILKDILRLAAIPVVEWDGLEADDLIAVAAMKMPVKERTLIISSDKDLLQLCVHPNTCYFSPSKEKYVTGDNFLDYTRELLKKDVPLGVPKEKWILFRALVGDSSDDLSGIKGIGPKTAAKLLESYATSQEIVDAVAKGTIKSKALATITQEELDIQYGMHDLTYVPNSELADTLVTHIEAACKPKEKDLAALRGEFMKWDMNSLSFGNIGNTFADVPSL